MRHRDPVRGTLRWLPLLSVLCLSYPAYGQPCTADCDGNGAVTVNEIVTVLNIGLGSRPLADCPAGDGGGDGSITVDEIVAGLNFALNGCPIEVSTPTFVPTITPTPDPDGPIRLDLGSGSGFPGAVVRIPITLSNNNDVATAVSVDITYDTTHIRVVELDGVPCTLNPAIGPGTVPDKMLLSAVVTTAPPPLEIVRVGIIAFTNMLPIPNGVVANCDFRIAPAAPPGTVALENLPDASDINGEVPPIAGANGLVTIR